jgi:hypothetical protein
MFPLSNLARHGMDGDHDRSMSFWIAERGGNPDVIAPDPRRDGHAVLRRRALVRRPRQRWPGSEVIGVIGARAQARPLIAALGLGGVATELDEDDPQFTLDLDLIWSCPTGRGACNPSLRADRHEMIEWRRLASMRDNGQARLKGRGAGRSAISKRISHPTHTGF